MNFPFYIAKRYLFSKKSTNVINLISAISVVGVAIATMALVVTLSVFNGFHDLVATLFTSFDPQLQVVPTQGKTVPADDPILTEIRQLPEIDVVTETVEDQALAIYKGRQAMVKVKGVAVSLPFMLPTCNTAQWASGWLRHSACLPTGTAICISMPPNAKGNST